MENKNPVRRRVNTKRLAVIHWANFGSYPGHCVYIQNYSYVDTMKYLKRIKAKGWIESLDEPVLFSNETWGRAGERSVKFKGEPEKKYYFIIVPEGINTKDPEDLIALAHECLHIAQFFLPRILDRDVEREAEAYFHTHLMRQIVDCLDKPN